MSGCDNSIFCGVQFHRVFCRYEVGPHLAHTHIADGSDTTALGTDSTIFTSQASGGSFRDQQWGSSHDPKLLLWSPSREIPGAGGTSSSIGP